MISFDSQIKVIKSHGFKNITTILKYSHVHLDLCIFCEPAQYRRCFLPVAQVATHFLQPSKHGSWK